MKRYIVCLLFSSSVMAFDPSDTNRDGRIDFDEAVANPAVPSIPIDPNHTQAMQNQRWELYNRLPESGDSSQKTITRFSVSNGTTRLQPSNTHTCVVGQVGGFYGRGLKGIEVDVYQQSGYWYLKALHNSGGSSNWATATCWNN